VGSIELGFMKLGFIGKADVILIDVIIKIVYFKDVSSIERRLEVVRIGNRL